MSYPDNKDDMQNYHEVILMPDLGDQLCRLTRERLGLDIDGDVGDFEDSAQEKKACLSLKKKKIFLNK